MSARRSRFCSVRSSLCRASFLWALYLLIPAASSNITLLSVLDAFKSCSIWPCSIIEYARAPTPVSINSSRMSLSRQTLLFMLYSLSPLLYIRRVIWTWSVSIASRPELLEINRLTSAVPAGFLLLLPLNITSAIWSLRRLFTRCSPRTHLTASTTLLLPQPLGPTIAVIGESKTNSVLSAKLLNPLRAIFSSLISFSVVDICYYTAAALFPADTQYYYRPRVCFHLIFRSIFGRGPTLNSARTISFSTICSRIATIS